MALGRDMTDFADESPRHSEPVSQHSQIGIRHSSIGNRQSVEPPPEIDTRKLSIGSEPCPPARGRKMPRAAGRDGSPRRMQRDRTSSSCGITPPVPAVPALHVCGRGHCAVVRGRAGCLIGRPIGSWALGRRFPCGPARGRIWTRDMDVRRPRVLALTTRTLESCHFGVPFARCR